MIIFDGDKYSCVACIRGHRSSTCKHSDRMLVKVRTRGRPSPMDVRKVIMVDTDSQVEPPAHTPEDPNPCCQRPNANSKSCNKMNKQPILFLRAMRTQKALLVDGMLKIMVEDNESVSIDSKKKFKLVSEREYMLKHSNNRMPDCCSCKSEEAELPENEFEQRTASFQSVKTFHNGNDVLSTTATPPPPITDENQMVELLTHKGVYLSTQCSCEDDNCQCDNCLIHRKEEELNKYIRQSGIPLTNLGNGRVTDDENSHGNGSIKAISCSTESVCRCPPQDCICPHCLDHPGEIISMSNLLLHGVLNAQLKRKTTIKYRNKLIPSKYWWDFIKLQIPLMSRRQLESLDLLRWFDSIVEAYGSFLLEDHGDDMINLHEIEMMLDL